MQLHYNTPVLSSKHKPNLFFKIESLQPSGSFKIRGIGHQMQLAFSQGIRNFICSSGGNAGLAAAYASQRLGTNIEVVLPETSPASVHQKLSKLGANITIFGSSWNNAHNYSLKKCKKTKALYVHPFEGENLWDGHSTIVDEIIDQIGVPDTIVLSVGGGGLLMGVLKGLTKNNITNTKIIACETEGAASLHQSLINKKLITLDKIDTIATSLGAKTISEQVFNSISSYNIESKVLSDNDAISGASKFFQEFNILTEAACGVSIESAYNLTNFDNKKIVAIACGGVSWSNSYMNKIISV